MDRGWRTVVCAATGPSFTLDQARQITKAQQQGLCRVIVINDSWRMLPFADVLYACDGAWWNVNIDAVRGSGFQGELWTQDKRAAPEYKPAPHKPPRPPDQPPFRGMHYIECLQAGQGLSTKPGRIHAGRNSGLQAINLAYLFGARRVVLVGFDMQRTGGKQHWFGDHPAPLINSIPFAACIEHFGKLAVDLERHGVECVNATISTALTCFKRATLAETL